MAKKANVLEVVKSHVVNNLDASRKQAEKEMAKIKQQVDSSIKQVDDYVTKNPEKAAMISAGIGAALGAALALLVGGKGSKKKK